MEIGFAPFVLWGCKYFVMNMVSKALCGNNLTLPFNCVTVAVEILNVVCISMFPGYKITWQAFTEM